MVSTGSTAVRRGVLITLVLVMVVGLLLAQAGPARAGVTGGCNGSADFSTDAVGAYDPSFDTRGNPIIVPKAEGEVVTWAGNVPGDNKDFSGTVDVRIGPAYLTVADWGFPNFDGSNVDNLVADTGQYDMEEFWSVIPGGRNVAQGIYQARASHDASGVACDAAFFVKFEGSALDSPIVLALLVIVAVLLILLFLAGRRQSEEGRIKGRLILAIIVGLLLGLLFAILLQQFGVWPLDNLTVLGLPILMLILGIIIGVQAPFGGSASESV